MPSRRAYHELAELGLTLHDVTRILEEGVDVARSRRRRGLVERGIRIGKKVIRVVAEERTFVYPDGFKEKVWYIIHASKETFKKRR